MRDAIMLVMMDGSRGSSLAAALVGTGYAVRLMKDCSRALSELCREPPALLIVCGVGALDACQAFRRVTTVPILVLLHDPRETDILAAFAAGVDDCQATTIGQAEALRRVRALLRRGCSARPPDGATEAQ